MALPYNGDVEFSRRGSYSPHEDAEPVKRLGPPTEMKGDVVFESTSAEVVDMPPSEKPKGSPNTVLGRVMVQVDRFQSYLARKFCPVLAGVPTYVFLIILLVMVILFITVVAVLIALALSFNQEAEEKPVPVKMQRIHTEWPLPEAHSLTAHVISSRSLVPPNISICSGFGFSCAFSPGTVIGSYQRCDGTNDCPDYSDETSCKVCQTGFSCPVDEKYVLCLRGTKICDGVLDCKDGSDEGQFCRAQCNNDELKCMGVNMCIPSKYICDGDVHCKMGDDEQNCRGQCQNGAIWCDLTQRCIPKWQLCNGVKDCPDGCDEWHCKCKECSGSNKALCSNSEVCISRSRLCDGKVDCPNGDDEKGCPGSCPFTDFSEDPDMVLCSDGRYYHRYDACCGLLEQCKGSCPGCDKDVGFTCANSKCIPRQMVCDGMDDCGDGSDETDCGCFKQGSDMAFNCSTLNRRNATKCIKLAQRCDGYQDCPGGEDENGCSKCGPEAVHCKSSDKCILKTKRCDGVEDCEDGSDEENCDCYECSRQPHPMYKCSNSQRCFPRELVCSPKSRCPDPGPMDKLYCAHVALLALQKR